MRGVSLCICYYFCMWLRLQTIWSKPVFFVNIGLSVFFHLAAWVLLSWYIKPQSELIVLHYSVYYGVDRVGTWSEAYLLPVFGLFLLLLNTGLALFFIDRHRLLSWFFLVCTTLFELFLLVGTIVIIVSNASAL